MKIDCVDESHLLDECVYNLFDDWYLARMKLCSWMKLLHMKLAI
jgi:hypothetical protein